MSFVDIGQKKLRGWGWLEDKGAFSSVHKKADLAVVSTETQDRLTARPWGRGVGRSEVSKIA